MSRVTVVPASAAASQILRALSRAMRSPFWGRDWPTAESLTETSANRARPVSFSAVSRLAVILDH
jgi:hypothetical protein